MSRIVVIGAGFAGLSAGAVLAVRGHAVTILEAAPTVDGLACRTDANWARIDLGPTILTDLAPLGLLSERLGASPSDLADLTRLDPGFLATFPGNIAIPIHADPGRMRSAVGILGPEAAADWERFQDLGSRAFRLASHYYARGDLHSLRDFGAFVAGGGVALRDVAPFLRMEEPCSALFQRSSGRRNILLMSWTLFRSLPRPFLSRPATCTSS